MSRRLLIVSPTAGRGGAEAYMLNMASAAVSRGWKVSIALDDVPGTHELAAELRAHRDVEYLPTPISDDVRRGAVLRQGLRMAWLVRKSRSDATMVVLQWPTSGLGCIIGAALAGARTMVVFQLAPWPVELGRWGRAVRAAHRCRQQWIAVSDQNRDALVSTFGISPTDIRTIYNGVARWERLGAEEITAHRRALRGELGLPLDSTVILTVGRLHAQKGHRDLVAALPRVLEGRSNTFVVLVGEGELRREIERALTTERFDRQVLMLGHRSDSQELLLGADLFILPSHFEGHPLALMEALTREIPVVVSDVGGTPELVRHGVDGLIHRRADPSDLAEKLSWALDHPTEMQAMARSGRLRAEQFDEDRMLNETFATLDELAPRAGSAASRSGVANLDA